MSASDNDLRGMLRLVHAVAAEEAASVTNIADPVKDRELRDKLLSTRSTTDKASQLPRAVSDPKPAVDGRTYQPAGKRRVQAIAALFLAACAAIVLVGGRYWPRSELPSYSISIRGESDQLGSTDPPAERDVVRLGPGSQLSLTLRPATAVHAEVTALLFIQNASSGAVQAWRVEPKQQEGGAFLVKGRIGDWPELAAGVWDVLAVIGSSRSMPTEAALVSDISQGRTIGSKGGSLQILKQRIKINPSQ